MFLDLILREDRTRRLAPVLTIAGLVAGLIASIVLWNDGRSAFSVFGGHPMLVADNFAVALNIIFALTGILTVLLSVNYLQRTAEAELTLLQHQVAADRNYRSCRNRVLTAAVVPEDVA